MQRVRTPQWIERRLRKLGCSPEQVERHLANLQKQKQVTVSTEPTRFTHRVSAYKGIRYERTT